MNEALVPKNDRLADGMDIDSFTSGNLTGERVIASFLSIVYPEYRAKVSVMTGDDMLMSIARVGITRNELEALSSMAYGSTPELDSTLQAQRAKIKGKLDKVLL